MKNFVIVTPDDPEVPPRNWDIHVLRVMEKCGTGISVLPHVRKHGVYFEVCFLTLGNLILEVALATMSPLILSVLKVSLVSVCLLVLMLLCGTLWLKHVGLS